MAVSCQISNDPNIPEQVRFVSRRTQMSSATYAVFRDAILAEKQVVCSYEQRHRELCPLVLGTTKEGEEAVLAWQFAGEVGKGKLPEGGAWKCFRLAKVRNASARVGPWYEGGSHAKAQTCVTNVDLDINIHVRKRRPP
jgi:predicted DNA-binding transcriptional regulator YafY